MDILDIRAIEGKNIYSERPVIVLKLGLGEYRRWYTDQIEDFNNRLLKSLPGLKEHYCSKGKPGGFVERLAKGTLLGHVVEHIALELQFQTGSDVVYGKTSLVDEPDIYDVVFEYEVKEVGRLAGEIAVQLVKSILNDTSWCLEENLENLSQTFAYYSLGPSTKAIINACYERNIPVLRLNSGSLLQLGYGIKQMRVQATITTDFPSTLPIIFIISATLALGLILSRIAISSLPRRWARSLALVTPPKSGDTTTTFFRFLFK
jgi:cyanophycin synthetase